MSTTVMFEGYTLTLHDWDDWVPPGPPVDGPIMTWDNNTTHAIHYTAAVNLIDGDLGEFQYNIPPFLRAVHKDYLTHRPQPNGATGYSIGYNHAVDWLGGIWKLRGFDIKCAANSGWNEWTMATLCLVDGSDPMTPEALRSVRYLYQEACKRAGRVLDQQPHSRLKSDGTLMPWPGNVTGCPGNGIRGQILSGVTKYATVTPEPPPDPEPPITPSPPFNEEDEMKPKIYRFPGYWNQFLLTSGGWIHGTVKLAQQWAVDYGTVTLLDPHRVGLKAALYQCGLKLSDLTPSNNGEDISYSAGL